VIDVAYGPDKISAAHAAIRGGYLQGLVTHTDLAQQLLRDARLGLS
jgi:DNA-binding transcriptional regulator LsrR (DeoR family)